MDDRDIIAALATVKDPELGRGLVDLGMVRDVHADDDVVRATLALCRIGQVPSADGR